MLKSPHYFWLKNLLQNLFSELEKLNVLCVCGFDCSAYHHREQTQRLTKISASTADVTDLFCTALEKDK